MDYDCCISRNKTEIDLKNIYVRNVRIVGSTLRSRTPEVKAQILAELVEKGMVSKTRDKNGRSFNIKTTPKFAEYFKLKGDIRALVKTLKIDNGGVKDKPQEKAED